MKFLCLFLHNVKIPVLQHVTLCYVRVVNWHKSDVKCGKIYMRLMPVFHRHKSDVKCGKD